MRGKRTGAVVVVCEVPNDDPVVIFDGDVQVIEVSSYLASSYAEPGERAEAAETVAEYRRIAGRLAVSHPKVSAFLVELADQIETATS